MIEEIGVDVMWFGPWCLYTLLITLLVLVNKNDKRGMKMRFKVKKNKERRI